MEVVSPGANGHARSSNSVTTIDPNVVIQHLVDLLEVTLGASAEDLKGSESLLSASKRQDTVQRCTRFASESHVALYVQKDVLLLESAEENSQGLIGQQNFCCRWDLDADFRFQEMSRNISTHCHPRYLFRPPRPPQWH